LPKDFLDWATEHGKEYVTDSEWEKALAAYVENTQIIRDLNAMQDGAEYGHTRFSDLTGTDFAKKHLPAKRMDPDAGKGGGELPEPMGPPPVSFDWRSSGAVTPVKDQSSCGSCWAESAVENIESAWYLANKKTLSAPVPLSVQEIIECDAYADACYGGFPKDAYRWVIQAGGMTSEAEYPYQVNGATICLANQTFNQTCGDGMCEDPPLTSWCDLTCSSKKHKNTAQISSWRALPTDEDQLASYLAEHGPISVGIDASGRFGLLFPWLQFYKRGIANPRRCTTKNIDHAVLLVGFGEESGTKYWIVKNSWGAKWGEAGYFRLQRGESKCGINQMATTAIVGQEDPLVI